MNYGDDFLKKLDSLVQKQTSDTLPGYVSCDIMNCMEKDVQYYLDLLTSDIEKKVANGDFSNIDGKRIVNASHQLNESTCLINSRYSFVSPKTHAFLIDESNSQNLKTHDISYYHSVMERVDYYSVCANKFYICGHNQDKKVLFGFERTYHSCIEKRGYFDSFFTLLNKKRIS